MKIKTENLGAYALVGSIVMTIAGTILRNDLIQFTGGLMFVAIVANICSIVDKNLKRAEKDSAVERNIKKAESDVKIELIKKAYKDGKISDDVIANLIKDLSNPSVNKVEYIEVSKPQPVYVPTPVHTVEEPVVIESTAVEEVETVEESNNKDIQVLSYIIDNGRFLFEYNGNKISFGNTNVKKHEYLHEEYNDSIGYYINADAVFYIYPASKEIVAVRI